MLGQERFTGVSRKSGPLGIFFTSALTRVPDKSQERDVFLTKCPHDIPVWLPLDS